MSEERFQQLKSKGFEHSFIDTMNTSISYICDNPIDCENIVRLLNDLNNIKQADYKKKLERLENYLKKEYRFEDKELEEITNNPVFNNYEEII